MIIVRLKIAKIVLIQSVMNANSILFDFKIVVFMQVIVSIFKMEIVNNVKKDIFNKELFVV